MDDEWLIFNIKLKILEFSMENNKKMEVRKNSFTNPGVSMGKHRIINKIILDFGRNNKINCLPHFKKEANQATKELLDRNYLFEFKIKHPKVIFLLTL